MSTTRIFRSGKSRRRPEVVLRLLRKNLRDAFAALAAMPKGFMLGERRDEPPQERKV